MATTTPGYLLDIHAQPEALERLLAAGLAPECRELLQRLHGFDRVVLTGMGSSLHACWPTYLRLAAAGVAVWAVETADLLGPAGGLLTPNTLLWCVSQSGNSAETVALLDALPAHRPVVLGTTDDLSGTLAREADVVLALQSGPEQTVSTKSYLNTLAALALATDAALGESGDRDLAAAPSAVADYLAGWHERMHELDAAIGSGPLFLLGRGASMAAVSTGSLIIKEAAKHPVEGMSVPQFRHGPLDMAGPDVSIVVLAGSGTDRARNRDMLDDLAAAGARTLWLDPEPGTTGVRIPQLPGPHARAVAEILPLQLLSVVLAERGGIEPGAFQRIGKVTQTL